MQKKKKILIINGHPDPAPERFCAALAAAYQEGAQAAGHEVRELKVGALDFPLIRDRKSFEYGDPPATIAAAQEQMIWADHLLIVHPLWLGAAPALLKGFFEQTFRYGFALPRPEAGASRGQLAGRTARIVVTMGMPDFVYGLVFGGFGVRAMVRGILGISGVKPVRRNYVGMVESMKPEQRRAWLNRMRRLGGLAA